MSTASAEAVRDLALGLPEAERAELAFELLGSLDGPPDVDVEQAWDREIERRLDDVDAGKASVLDSAEFLDRLRAATRG